MNPLSRPVRVAIFASGGGSNARTLLRHFRDSEVVEIILLASENPKSGIFTFAPDFGVKAVLFPPRKYRNGDYLAQLLNEYSIDLLVLAGYLKKIPDAVIADYPERILNIHPSLLPKFGGKGMYGMHVHEAVIAAGESQSGMTIHLVNEVYDEGQIIFQESVEIQPEWTAKDLQRAVLRLEHRYYPLIVEKVAKTVQIADN